MTVAQRDSSAQHPFLNIQRIWVSALLTVSIMLNLIMLMFLSQRILSSPLLPFWGGARRCLSEGPFRSHPTWLNDSKPELPQELSTLDRRIPFRGQLTHLLYVLRDDPSEVEAMRLVFDYWRHYPPCLSDSYPSNAEQSHIELSFYFVSKPSPQIVQQIRHLFDELPQSSQACFSAISFRHADIKSMGMEGTPEEERAMWRQVFTGLLTNSLGLQKAKYVLVLASECVPVQPDWLNLVDYQSRPLFEAFWIKGSIFRGYINNKMRSLPELIRLGSSALYNLADRSFADFYLTRVQPWLDSANCTHPPLNAVGDRWNADIFHYLADCGQSFDFWYVLHHFQFSNFLSDYHGMKISLKRVHETQPDTYLVCGHLVNDE